MQHPTLRKAMASLVKILIDVETENMFSNYVSGNITIKDMLFSDVSNGRVFDHKELVKNTKRAIKLLGNFSMITITLTQGDQFESYPKIKGSYRFRNTYDTVKMAPLENQMYTDWNNVSLQVLWVKIKELALQGSQLHQATVREQSLTNQE